MEGVTESSNKTELNPKEFNFQVDKKKIYRRKTHYRNLDIENKLDPTKDIQEQDERELTDWHRKLLFDRKYIKIQDDWQKNLIKNKKKKALTKHRFENYVNRHFKLF